MEESNAKQYLNKKVKIILTNNFRYQGIIQDVSSDSLQILDKFNKEVTIQLNCIMILTEVLEDGEM